MDTDQPLFKSAHAALVFAFNFAGQQFDKSAMARMAAASAGGGIGLGGLDGAAQAGMIRARLERLEKVARAVIVARVAPRRVPCSCRRPCCAGSEKNREWTDAIAVLTDEARHTALAGTTADRAVRRACVVRFFDKNDVRQTYEAMAKEFEINRRTATAYADKVAAWLKDREKTAITQMDGYLRDFGPVGEEILRAA